MKHIVFILVAGLTLSSCQKEYVCECSTRNSTTEFPITVVKKRDAVQRCTGFQDVYNINLDSAYTCRIK
jgi:hypothetical protein